MLPPNPENASPCLGCPVLLLGAARLVREGYLKHACLKQRADDLVLELGAVGAAISLHELRNWLRIFRCFKHLDLVLT